MSTLDTAEIESQAITPEKLGTHGTGAAPSTHSDIRVIRRNGSIAPYDDSKITVAVTKAFLAVEGGNAAASTRIHETIAQMTQQITDTFQRRKAINSTIHIEDIQDQVELELMRAGHHKVARSYVLYREQRAAARKVAQQQVQPAQRAINIVYPDGSRKPLSMQQLRTLTEAACSELAEVDAEAILHDAERNLFDGATIEDVNKVLVMAGRTLIEKEPNYSYVTARLLLKTLYDEALAFINHASINTHAEMTEQYPSYFTRYLEQGIELELISPELLTFDLAQITAALQPKRDFQFSYLGLQTLYDRYFLHSGDKRFELPQAFFMRVAMGLAIQEDNREQRAIEFYNLLSSFDFMSSTPTLFNSGTLRPQLSSCYLTTVPDSLRDIYSAIQDNALLSKYAGGLGNDWTPVRAMGAHIKGTNGRSQGVIPFLKVANDTAVAVNQGGKRKGAVCAYLETWHLDIEEFLEARKNTGDERRRTHDMNTANWIPDLFMQRVFEDDEWTLFSPNEVTKLHDCYGKDFIDAYTQYEQMAATGEIKNFKKISATKLWRKMLSMLFETGHPWVTFKDTCNIRSPQQHAGVVHSSNLCTEITLNTSADEVAVCNLGSINLVQHLADGQLDQTKLQKTIRTAIRMLDNVIDINYYSVPQAENSNYKHRPIGMGLMGFQDALYELDINYASDAAIEFADRSMELISYYAIEASSDLAVERGSYSSYQGSHWSQGILPIDSISHLQKARGQYLEQDQSQTLDWQQLRDKIKRQGMRNSNTMAIAPTATISNICGISASIEPTYQNLYVKSNLSGEFTIVNPYLVRDLKQIGLWDNVMVNDIKYFDGSIQRIDRIPTELKQRYATAFEIEPRWLVDCASRRQKWIDQAQSLNLYIKGASGRKLDTLYRMAWIRGLKTTYYCRTLGATSTEKSTINNGTLNAVKGGNATQQACAIDDPDCEACQ